MNGFTAIPFWVWLLLSVACGVVYLLSLVLSESKRGGIALASGVLFALAGFIFLMVGAIRFVKLVWQ